MVSGEHSRPRGALSAPIFHAWSSAGGVVDLAFGFLSIATFSDEPGDQGDLLIERGIVASESLRDQHRTEQYQNTH